MAGAQDLNTRRDRFGIVDALNAEWSQQSSVRHEVVAGWAEGHLALSGCSTLADVLTASSGNSDEVLRALLVEHSHGCALAARVVLQCLLGKIVLMSLRDNQAEVGDYVAAAWCRICTYPLERRPQKIAANIALDALKAVKDEKRWARQDVRVSTGVRDSYLDEVQSEEHRRATVDHNADVGAMTADHVVALAGRLGLLDGGTRSVMLSVYSDGLTGREAADRHGTSVDMIRFRCSKAVRRLAQHATSLAEAA